MVLKTIRSEIKQALEEVLCYEAFTRAPSESRDGRQVTSGAVLPTKMAEREEREGKLGVLVMPRPRCAADKRAVIGWVVNPNAPNHGRGEEG